MRERVLKKTTEIGRHLGDKLETKCNENSQQSTEMNLVKTPHNGDMEPELAISCNQARHPVEGLGYQPSHKNFNLQFFHLQNVLG